MEVIQSRPIRGAGLGTAAPQAYIADWNLYHADFPYVHSHNFYLEVWIEAGLLGAASWGSSSPQSFTPARAMANTNQKMHITRG